MDSIRQIAEQVEAGVKGVFESDTYRNYLSTMSRFHSYSLNNTILIYQQKPDATYVAGYQAWYRSFGRWVRKGEKSIRIMAPITKVRESESGENTSGKRVIVGYRAIPVFDISQTDGAPLPSFLQEKIDGEVEDYDSFRAALELASPVPIRYENLEGRANGYYSLERKEIVIDDSLSELQTVKTIIHEVSHAMLHSGKNLDIDRRTMEVQAESIACAVCMHYHLDPSEYSFGYIAGWSRDQELSELKKSMEVICHTSHKIIHALDQICNPDFETHKNSSGLHAMQEAERILSGA